jgi:hypothetical protein
MYLQYMYEVCTLPSTEIRTYAIYGSYYVFYETTEFPNVIAD